MKNIYIINVSIYKKNGKKIMRKAPVQADRVIRNQKIVVPPLIIARPFFDLQPYF